MKLHVKDQMFNLRKAREEDKEKILSLLVGAAEWLQTKGTSQWDYYMTDLEANTEEVLESIKNQSTYLLEQDGLAAASVILEENPGDWDREIWGEESAQTDVVYLHRLVVNRNFAGRGIGDALMEWAKKHVRGREKKYIRFDCLNSNEGLNSYYQRQCSLKGIADVYGKHSKYEIVL
ncbi:GNAT family N-acetyltransferase [Bacillus sp. SCS-153A]|uniref:GNAT family N-acetyltransferase n=1 Tax=Rossellomorea sedimentorum TaxID=3115294 RepID=UPI003905DA00